MEDFVTFEIAQKLKEKGFTCKYPFAMYNELGIYHPLMTSADYETCDSGFKCRCYYDYDDFDENDYIAPTISQVLKWLREKKGWIIVVRLYSTNGWYWFIQDKNGELKSSHLASCDDCFATYEQSALAGIEYALNYLL